MFHFIGLGGIGMSGLARLLVQEGFPVSGSDETMSPLLEELSALGVKVFIGHKPEQVQAGATVVYTSAIKESNPEWQKTRELRLKTLHRSELLHQLAHKKKALAVTGTHGKTTTTTLLTALLQGAAMDPSYMIGGICLKNKVNASCGEGDYFVLEADESDGTFLNYRPFGAIVTNIDDDHLDHFGSLANLKRAFREFTDFVQPERLFWCYDNAPLRDIGAKGFSYGFEKGADLQLANFRSRGFTSLIDIQFEGQFFRDIELRVPGRELSLNAAAAFGLAFRLGASEAALRQALKNFVGVKRRREVKLDSEQWLVLDDYGHHPTEVKVTLKALKEALSPRRLVVLFQPHRYSRTKLCFEGFKTAFTDADLLILTDLYSAGEAPIEGISSEHLATTLGAHHYAQSELLEKTLTHLLPGDVIVTMGAGSITTLSDQLSQELQL